MDRRFDITDVGGVLGPSFFPVYFSDELLVEESEGHS